MAEGLRKELAATQDEAAAAMEKADDRFQKCQQQASAALLQTKGCEAQLQVEHEKLQGVVAVCNALIEGLNKGQRAGAYSLEEAAELFGGIRKLQALVQPPAPAP